MKRFMAILILCFCILGLGACEKSHKPTQMGGVDGSGGDLKSHQRDSLKLWVEKVHPQIMKNVARRLVESREAGPLLPSNSRYYMIMEKFFSEEPESLLESVNSVTYKMADQACLSGLNGVGENDASIDGSKVCLSYKAFKNISKEYLIKRLVELSLHEIGHLRGFNEEQATELQEAFANTNLLDLTVLVGNQDYADRLQVFLDSMITLNEIVTFLGYQKDRWASDARKATLCQLAAEMNKNLYGAYGILPSQVGSIRPTQEILSNLEAECSSDDSKVTEIEIAVYIGRVIESIITLYDRTLSYASEFCEDDSCRGMSSQSPHMLKAAFDLRHDQIFDITNSEEIRRDIRCTLVDEESGKVLIDYQTEGENKQKDKFFIGAEPGIDKNIGHIALGNRGSFRNAVALQFVEENVRIAQVENFYRIRGGVIGGLSSEVSSMSARLEIMIENEKPNKSEFWGLFGDFPLGNYPYWNNRPYYFSVSQKRKIEKVYLLNCWLLK